MQELKSTDYAKWLRFADWILTRQRKDDTFSKKIIFIDEEHFHVSWCINKQNCRIWGSESPRVSQQIEIHPERVTV